jgi:hypothetical protein
MTWILESCPIKPELVVTTHSRTSGDSWCNELWCHMFACDWIMWKLKVWPIRLELPCNISLHRATGKVLVYWVLRCDWARLCLKSIFRIIFSMFQPVIWWHVTLFLRAKKCYLTLKLDSVIVWVLELSFNSTWVLVGSWLFCLQNLPCLVSLWCMRGGKIIIIIINCLIVVKWKL